MRVLAGALTRSRNCAKACSAVARVTGLGVHMFISERAFDNWSAALQHYKSQAYEKILPGHGAPGGKELYGRMQNYLSTARDLLSKVCGGDDLKARLIAAFPDFGGSALLDHQKRFLFPPGVNITVTYGGQNPVPKPFIMVLLWIKTQQGWKMGADIPIPVPPDPARR